MKITKDDRHEYSKKRRKLVRKGLNPYDDKMLINLDKEWAQLRLRISDIKHTTYGTLTLMHDFEDSYYSSLGYRSEEEKIIHEINAIKGIVKDSELLEELESIIDGLKCANDLESYLKLKRLIVRMQSKLDIPIHFYEALDDEYRQVFTEVMNDTFKVK